MTKHFRHQDTKTQRLILANSFTLYLSAPIHYYGNILAVIFFPTRTLNVEWIRFLFLFLDRIYRINEIFFACGEIPLG